MPNSAELHASSVELPGPGTLEGEILDPADVPEDEVRCIVPAADGGRFATDPCDWTPYPGPDGLYYPKKGDRALVSVHDGPDTIIFWEPGERSPDVPAAKGSGEGGGADANYVHEQGIASTTWEIHHSLGKLPAIQLYGPDGSQIEGDVRSVTTTTATVQFLAATTGKAVLN